MMMSDHLNPFLTAKDAKEDSDILTQVLFCVERSEICGSKSIGALSVPSVARSVAKIYLNKSGADK
jgi:hypothetical protein